MKFLKWLEKEKPSLFHFYFTCDVIVLPISLSTIIKFNNYEHLVYLILLLGIQAYSFYGFYKEYKQTP